MFTEAEIIKNFPLKDFRPGQKEAIAEILKSFDSGKRAVILEGPTGAGKSAIALTIAQFFDRSYYLTTQKILQTQIMRDFGSHGVVDLKGRNAYPCTYWTTYVEKADERGTTQEAAFAEMEKLAKHPVLSSSIANKYLSCSKGVCKLKENKSKCKLCFPTSMQVLEDSYCPYWKRLYEAQMSRICLMNFSSFLYQTAIGDRFNERDLMIIDECHNTESALMDFIAFSLTDKSFTKFDIKIPEFETAQEYAEYFDQIKLGDKIIEMAQFAAYSGDSNTEEEWKRTLWQYKKFRDASSAEDWVPVFENNKKYRRVTLKPIFVRDQAQEYLFRYAKKILFMSATVLSPPIIYDSLGIPKEEAYAYRMKNRFNAKNRPIYFKPSGSMSYKNKQDTLPILARDITEICHKYKGKRGIIHTHSFDIAKYLIENCDKDVSSRFLFQEEWHDKQAMLTEHGARSDTIIIAPAMHEGLDLKDDLSRFQIICKVPYPSFVNNKQLKIRMELSPTYYDWLTALKLVQSYGRSIRSETDYADTYIMDLDFRTFQAKTRMSRLLPEWFTEAIIRT